METKHTPGPWAVQADPEWAGKHPLHDNRFVTTRGMDLGRLGLRNDRDEIICKMTDSRNQAANARLIAAAPELLSALDAAVTAYEVACKIDREDEQDETGHPIDPRIIAARAAIAKATGE